jgi:hypothetical protein
VVSFTPRPLYPRGKRIGSCVRPRAGLDMEKRKFLPLPGLKLQLLGCPARGKSPYRLRYRGSTSSEVGTKCGMCIVVISLSVLCKPLF